MYQDILFLYLPLVNTCTRTLRLFERALQRSGWPLNVQGNSSSEVYICGVKHVDDVMASWVRKFTAATINIECSSGPLATKEQVLKNVADHVELLRAVGMIASLNFGGHVDQSTSSPHVDAFVDTLPFSAIWLRSGLAIHRRGADKHKSINEPLSPGSLVLGLNRRVCMSSSGEDHDDGGVHDASVAQKMFLADLVSHQLYGLRGARLWGHGVEGRADYAFVKRLASFLAVPWAMVEQDVLLPFAFGACDEFRGHETLLKVLKHFEKPYSEASVSSKVTDLLVRARQKLLGKVPALQATVATGVDSPRVEDAVHQTGRPLQQLQRLCSALFDIAARRLVIVLHRISDRNRDVIKKTPEARSAA